MRKLILLSWLLMSWCLLSLINNGEANLQADFLDVLIKSKRTKNQHQARFWEESEANHEYSAVFMEDQYGLMEADKIYKLPSQPDGVDFNQYSGYVTVDPNEGRTLFYYFVESPRNSATNPLLLWLNGGPGCSSFGYGAMSELGPFRVNSDGKTLFRNNFAWNNVANVIFLESPAGVGFSYSNSSSDYDRQGDKRTAEDSYTFIVNWLERFPQYKSRDFYIAGESYGGHYVPQLAYTILLNNKYSSTGTIINLKGIAIGNAWIDDATSLAGIVDYLWTHALISDQLHNDINSNCDFNQENTSKLCDHFFDELYEEVSHIDFYHIYAPLCHNPALKNGPPGSVQYYDPCNDNYVKSYLNLPQVQTAIHAKFTNWTQCRSFNWTDWPTTILPTIKKLMDSEIRVWIYSGDVDGRVPITSSKYSINRLNLPIKTSWHPWYTNEEVGGYVVGYEGLTLVTIRGAGHLVPSYQPERALTMISSFLQGILPPSA